MKTCAHPALGRTLFGRHNVLDPPTKSYRGVRASFNYRESALTTTPFFSTNWWARNWDSARRRRRRGGGGGGARGARARGRPPLSPGDGGGSCSIAATADHHTHRPAQKQSLRNVGAGFTSWRQEQVLGRPGSLRPIYLQRLAVAWRQNCFGCAHWELLTLFRQAGGIQLCIYIPLLLRPARYSKLGPSGYFCRWRATCVVSGHWLQHPPTDTQSQNWQLLSDG
jgi:hypothetical protein